MHTERKGLHAGQGWVQIRLTITRGELTDRCSRSLLITHHTHRSFLASFHAVCTQIAAQCKGTVQQKQVAFQAEDRQ